MARRPKPKFTGKQLSAAAYALGSAGWQARLEKFGLAQLREQLSAAGRLGGRPRKEKPAEQESENAA